MNKISIFFCLLSTSIVQASFIKDWFLEYKAHRAYESSNYQQANQDWTELLQKDPYDASVNYNIGLGLYNQKKYEASISYFKRAVEYAAHNNDLREQALFNSGNSYVQQNKLDDAIDMYEQVLKMNADNNHAKNNLEYVKQLKEEQKQQEQQKDQNKNQDQQQKDDQNDSSQDKQCDNCNDKKSDSKDGKEQDSENNDQRKDDQQKDQKSKSDKKDSQDKKQNTKEQDQEKNESDAQDKEPKKDGTKNQNKKSDTDTKNKTDKDQAKEDVTQDLKKSKKDKKEETASQAEKKDKNDAKEPKKTQEVGLADEYAGQMNQQPQDDTRLDQRAAMILQKMNEKEKHVQRELLKLNAAKQGASNHGQKNW